MKYQIYKLKFSTGVHLGNRSLEEAEYLLMADTLFSALCQEYLKIFDSELCTFVDKARNGNILISDAFPYIGTELYIPKPMIFIENASQQGDSILKKAYKKLKYIPISKFGMYLTGNMDVSQENSYFHGLGRKEIRENVSIRGENEPQPYRTGIYHFAEGNGLYLIIGIEKTEDGMILSELFESLGYTGIGGKRSSGLGKFEMQMVRIPSELKERLGTEDYSKYMTLSVSLPQQNELEKSLKNADYKIQKRSGFVQSLKYSQEQRRKNDLYVFQAGSCFTNKFAGDIYDVSNGGNHPVFCLLN
ncbi:MAG: type III-A CRISPR-associated RAMP protein Csm4, partial [Eubacteriales bacterium]|nr:type III-A CRISPR-associated RAMP protein Csm4 [Eubacteriales bacterium]